MKTTLLKLCDVLDLFPLFNVFTRNRATVFMMHHFCNEDGRNDGFLSAGLLNSCLSYLIDNGYSILALSDYINRLTHHSKCYKTVIFTVDDGYHDFYDYAYPVFRKYNIPATIFLTTDFIDGKIQLWWDKVKCIINWYGEARVELSRILRKNCEHSNKEPEPELNLSDLIEYCKSLPEDTKNELIDKLVLASNSNPSDPFRETIKALSWNEIIEMKNHNIEFFPHTKTHPILTRITNKEVEQEISESKRRIEGRLNTSADIFCYPNGRFEDFSDETITLLKKAGYVAALTAEEGFDHTQKRIDLFRLKRYSFPTDFIRFKQLVSGLEAFRHGFKRQ